MILVFALSASAASEARSTAVAQTATLQVIATGADTDLGLNVTHDGVPVQQQDAQASECTVAQSHAGNSCFYTVEQGQEVRLAPAEAASFVGWSVFECPGKDPCTITVDSDRTVIGTFTPTTLTISMTGGVKDSQGNDINGTVTSLDGKIKCQALDQTGCGAEFPAFAEVTLTAEPQSEFDKWSGACQEAGAAHRCTLLLSGDDVVGAKFKDTAEDPLIVPTRLPERLRVVIEPSGAGKVTSSRSRLSEAIDCPAQPKCEARFEQSEKPTLTAEALGGSTFVRWRGAEGYCSSELTCQFPAFHTTSIQAIFAPPTATRFDLKITKLTLLRRLGISTVVLRIVANQPATGTLRLQAKGRLRATKSYTLPEGTSLVRFSLPRSLAPGWYLLAARFTSSTGDADAEQRWIRLRR